MIDPHIHFGRLGNSLFQYAYIYAQCRRGEIPDIFIQDPAYFDGFRGEIQNLFNPDPSYLPLIALHLRVGKNPLNPNEPAYKENSFYVNLLETDYYQKALRYFSMEDILVFSDDNEFAEEWARKNVRENVWTIDESKDGLEALGRMASCKGIIVANSSLSWWAAYLNPQENKKIIAPSVERWYSDGEERTKCPIEWVRL